MMTELICYLLLSFSFTKAMHDILCWTVACIIALNNSQAVFFFVSFQVLSTRKTNFTWNITTMVYTFIYFLLDEKIASYKCATALKKQILKIFR